MKLIIIVILLTLCLSRKHIQVNEHQATTTPQKPTTTTTSQKPTTTPQQNNTVQTNGPTQQELQAANPARNIWDRLFGQLIH